MTQPASSAWHRGAYDCGGAVMLGRTAAACVHPIAAWRVISTSWRFLVLLAYVAASYVLVLAGLLVLSSNPWRQ
jgi:hypothetical protein